MKTTYISTIALAILLSTGCGNSEKKDGETTSEETKTEIVKASKQNGIDLKLKGDYARLYTESENCKLTTIQLTEVLGYNDGQVEEQSNYQGNCSYKVALPDNFMVSYGISLEKWGDKDIVEDAIKKGLKDDSIDAIQVSESGDTYLKWNPYQHFLLLLNPNYGNTIRISYSYINHNGPIPTDTQREEKKQNTYKLANYLINQYQN